MLRPSLGFVVFFSSFQTHPALLSPEKFSQEKRFEQLLASLEKNKETKKRRKKKERKRKKKRKKKNPEPKNPRVRASILNGRGWFFLWFLTEGKGERGLTVCTGLTPTFTRWGTPRSPRLWSLWQAGGTRGPSEWSWEGDQGQLPGPVPPSHQTTE